jgi:hypothetical protein
MSGQQIQENEFALERAVSEQIRMMPFLWIAVEDEPGRGSLRGYIERNSIALLNNYHRPPIDPPSNQWLGRYSDRERVTDSGLWNQNHVDEQHDPAFLAILDQYGGIA